MPVSMPLKMQGFLDEKARDQRRDLMKHCEVVDRCCQQCVFPTLSHLRPTNLHFDPIYVQCAKRNLV